MPEINSQSTNPEEPTFASALDNPPRQDIANSAPVTNIRAWETLYQAIKARVEEHEDNPQLLLMIGVFLNSVPKVEEALEVYGADGGEVVTARNQNILRQFGIVF
tara:strand:- start:4321 stop:4635 length:315 start_codon:yes stop_codon:yes gene_type:complete